MISLPPKGNDAKVLGSYFSPLKVQAQATPNMTVQVAEGAFWTAENEHQEFIGGTSPTISAPVADAKWVLVTVTKNGALNIINGASSANPVLPEPSLYKDELPLAAIFVGDTVAGLTNDMIYDIRPMWSIPPDSVSQDQLGDFATITYVNNSVATKADTDGTAEANFTLNVGGGAINDSGLYIDRAAGPDVAIRFNELATTGSPAVVTPQWEFTNDGATWNPIGVAEGSYYTKVDLDTGALNSLYYTQTDLSVTGILDSRYYTETEADAIFAEDVHTHVQADITDLAEQISTINSISPVVGNVELGTNELNDVTSTAPADAHVLVYRGTEFKNEHLLTDDLADVDTSTVAPVAKDVLVYSGSKFVNRPIIKTDISDFTGGEFVLTTNLAGDPPTGSNGTDQEIYGVKTFKDGVVIETSLTVTGTNTSIETTELKVGDNHVEINFGETGEGVGDGTGTAGIRVKRGAIAGSPANLLPDAIIQWDESAGQWEIGYEGLSSPIVSGAHNHTSADIVDFSPAVTTQLGLNDLHDIGDVNYIGIEPDDKDHLAYNLALHVWENKPYGPMFTAELNINDLEELQDVTYTTATAGEVLMYGGSPAMWTNHLLTKSDVSDFVEADYIHATGDESKVGNLSITGNLTVVGGVGTVTRLESEHVYITDTVIVLNEGELVDGGLASAGIQIDRGPSYQEALLRWDEGSGTWLATHTKSGSPFGAALSTGTLAMVGHTHVLTDVTDIIATAPEVNHLQGVTSLIQPQLDDKLSRAGDTMDASANLTFTFGGEALGLPAVPSATGASSKEYTDAQVLTVSTSLATHAADFTLHITTEQNTFLDGLSLAGSPPALLASDVNQLTGISGNVQTLLDGKTDLAIPATTGNLAALDAAGNLVDSLIIVNDGVITTSAIWTASKIDATKTDKIVPTLINNLAGLDATGNLTDSGLILNDSGTLISEIWSANKINATKTDKIVPTLINNLAGLDASGNLTDSGLILNDAGVLSSEVWSASKIDATKADKTVPALTNNIATLGADGNLGDSGVIVNDGGILSSEIWTANKIDTTKANKVPTAVLGNFAAFDATGDIVDSGATSGTFAPIVHTHVAANITDFSAAVQADITANTVLDDLNNLAVTAAVNGDVIQYSAGNWVNNTIFTAFGTDFVRSSGSVAESITGVKTFNDDAAFQGSVVVSQDLTVLGTTTTINSANLEVSDKNITVNAGYSGPTSGSTGSGIHVNRNETAGSPPTLDLATMVWNDATERWEAGLEGSEDVIALEGVTVAQPFYEMQQALTAGGSPVEIGVAVYTLGFGVPTPIAGKTGIQIFVNGVKQIEGAGKAYTVNYTNPAETIVTFTAGHEPTTGADVEFYGFGYIDK